MKVIIEKDFDTMNKGAAEIRTDLPVPFLCLHHDVTVILDEETDDSLKPEYK